MGGPVVAKAPYAVLVSVEDANLAVHRAGRAAISVGVECDSLDNVMIAMGDQMEGRVLLWWRGRSIQGRSRRHGRSLHRLLLLHHYLIPVRKRVVNWE